MFKQDFTCPALLKDLKVFYLYRVITYYDSFFHTIPIYYLKTTGLFPVRSSLLRKSQLISFPPDT
jgi:hypothetical protein